MAKPLSSSNDQTHHVLYNLSKESVRVKAYALEPPPNIDDPRLGPVDREFSIYTWFNNHCTGTFKSGRFKLERSLKTDERVANADWVLLLEKDWVDELGVDDDLAYNCTLEGMAQGLAQLLDEVKRNGRKSLTMFVRTRVLDQDEEED